jgi:hypothetical protein
VRGRYGGAPFTGAHVRLAELAAAGDGPEPASRAARRRRVRRRGRTIPARRESDRRPRCMFRLAPRRGRTGTRRPPSHGPDARNKGPTTMGLARATEANVVVRKGRLDDAVDRERAGNRTEEGAAAPQERTGLPRRRRTGQALLVTRRADPRAPRRDLHQQRHHLPVCRRSDRWTVWCRRRSAREELSRHHSRRLGDAVVSVTSSRSLGATTGAWLVRRAGGCFPASAPTSRSASTRSRRHACRHAGRPG